MNTMAAQFVPTKYKDLPFYFIVADTSIDVNDIIQNYNIVPAGEGELYSGRCVMDSAGYCAPLHPSYFIYNTALMVTGLDWNALDVLTCGQVRRALLDIMYICANPHLDQQLYEQTLPYEDIFYLCLKIATKFRWPGRDNCFVYDDFPRVLTNGLDFTLFTEKAQMPTPPTPNWALSPNR